MTTTSRYIDQTYRIAEPLDADQWIAARDLNAEAKAAAARGAQVDLIVAKHPLSGVRVETLIIRSPGGAFADGARAGQALGGSAVWGDWTDDDHGGFFVEDESAEIIFPDGTISEDADS